MSAEVITVRGFYGKPAVYERDTGLNPGTRLRLPFSELTRDIKDALRSLGFRCHYTEQYWELGPRQLSADKEAALRSLLEVGELPAGAARAMSAAGTPGVASEQHKRRRGEGEGAGEEGPLVGPQLPPEERQQGAQPAAAAAAAVPGQQQVRTDNGLEAVAEFHEGSAAHVTLRRGADGYVVLEGAGLWNIRHMLERILHFSPAAAEAVSPRAAAMGVGAAPPCWRSAWPLSPGEQQFVEAVLEHRKRSLRHATHDDREPVPHDMVVPPRFRPRARDGTAMRGPFKARRGPPHNIGRQFFSNCEKEAGKRSFLWADGSEHGSDEEQRRFEEWFMTWREETEDWEEEVPQESQEGEWNEEGDEGEGFDQELMDEF